MGRHLAIALLALLALDGRGAPDAQTRGRALAAEAEARDSGWGDQRATLEMTLRNRRGDESRRRLEVSTLEVSDDGDRSLTVRHRRHRGRPLTDEAGKVLAHLHKLWGFKLRFETVGEEGQILSVRDIVD